MKKHVESGLLILLGMLSSLGVFLFAFPFWDTILWLLYIPVLLLAVLLYNRLFVLRKRNIILLLAAALAAAGVLSFPVLREGAHIAYNVITDVYHDFSGYVFYPYDVSDNVLLYRIQFTWLLLYVSIWLYCGMVTFWKTRHYFALFMLSFLPMFFTLLYQTPIPWLFALPLIIFWFTLFLSRKGTGKGERFSVRLSAFMLSLLCVLFTFITAPPSSYELRSTSGSLRERLLQRVDELAYSLTHAGEEDGEVDLGKAANRLYTGATQLVVRSEDAKGTVYLKSYSGAIYEDNRWQTLPESSYDALASYDWNSVDTWLDKKNPAFTNILNRTGALMHLEIEDHRASKRYALTPYLMREAAPDTTPWYDAYRVDHEDVMRYTAYELSSTNMTGNPTAEQDDYAAFAAEHYLQIPSNLKNLFDEITPLQDIMSNGYENNVDEIQSAICSYLKDTTSYTLKPGRTPDDRDFVEFFLKENKKGYCVHYATSAVMMFRYMGIPARYAEGFSFHANKMTSGSIDVPDQSAHAWVEIFDSEKGWIPIEVTPGFQSESTTSSQTTLTRPQDQESNTAAAQQSKAAKQKEEEQKAAENKKKETLEEGSQFVQIGKTAAAAIIVLILMLTCILQRRLRISYRERCCLQKDAKKAICYSYQYLHTFMKDEELQETIRALCEEAMYSEHVMKKEQAILVYGYAQKQAGARIRHSSLIRRWKLRYIQALG